MGLLFTCSLRIFPLKGALHQSGAGIIQLSFYVHTARQHPGSSSTQNNAHLLHETLLLHIYTHTFICMIRCCCNIYMDVHNARHNYLRLIRRKRNIYNTTDKFTATHSHMPWRERPALKNNSAE